MRLLLLAVFCYGVDANQSQTRNNVAIRFGFWYSCGTTPIKAAIGPTPTDISVNRVKKFVKVNGNALKNNEEKVRNQKNLIYPCKKNDYECIRLFFGANCKCKSSYGPVPDPFYTAQTTVFLPSVNITATFSDNEFRGLSNSSIHSFYYNKKTRYVILSIEVPTLTVTTPNICYEYHRPGKESIIKCDYCIATYRSLIFTAEFPGLPNCRLDLAVIHGYIGDPIPSFDIGPNTYESTDPTVKNAYAALLKNLPLTVRENMRVLSQLVFAKYIESYICNFDVEICSV